MPECCVCEAEHPAPQMRSVKSTSGIYWFCATHDRQLEDYLQLLVNRQHPEPSRDDDYSNRKPPDASSPQS